MNKHNSRFLSCLLALLISVSCSLGGTIVRVRTSVGDIDVELYDADKPVTVQNFLQYVHGGNYINMFMHRVVPDFVMQGGNFNVIGRGTPFQSVQYVATLPPIVNEFNVGKFYSNVYGTIAMAKTSDPNSANSQFFFNLADNSASLDDTNNSGGFTVFGHVIAGTNLLNHFLVGGTNKLVKEVNLGGVYSELPVLYSASLTNITFDDLIYVDVSTPSNFTPLKATYNGLFTVPGDVAQQLAGFITVATTAGPKFTGNLRLGPARYTFSGSFNTNGYALVTAKSAKFLPLLVNLHPDAALGTDKLVGSISSDSWVADVAAYRVPAQASAYSGKYTLFLADTGIGSGFAAISVDSHGKAQIKGSLLDGTVVSQTVPVSQDGHFPFFAPLAGGNGSVSGWMTFTNRAEDNLNGTLLWTVPGAASFQTTGVGARYAPPTGGAPVIAMTNYSVIFSGGDLPAPFTNSMTLKAGNKLSNTSANKLTLSFTLSSGLFSGSVTPPGSQHGIPLKGALWQNRNSGYGYFLNSGKSGNVVLTP